MLIFPLINTPRLKLRKLKVEDFPSLIKYANNKKIADEITNVPYPYQEMDAVHRISYVTQGFNKKSHFCFAIEWKESSELIGEISLHIAQKNKKAELGYWVGKPFWGKGIATEAAKAIIGFGFEKLGLELIFATCHIENLPSQKVVTHNGMKKINTTGNVILFEINKPDQYAEI